MNQVSAFGRRLAPVLFVSAFALVACGGTKRDFTPPTTKTDGDKELYVDPPTLTPETSVGLEPGRSSPEAAVTHFYASRMRGDKAYEAVLPPPDKQEDAERLSFKLEKMSDWTFEEVKLVSKKQADGPNRLWIKVFLKIQRAGRSKGGTDDVEVIKIGEEWFVAMPPT